MKTMKQTLLIALLSLILTSPTFSQDFDANRMNRDIKIMENILSEMFKTQIISGDRTSTIRAGGYTFFGSNSSSNVKGTYIPGYGIIFMIPSSTGRSMVVSKSNSDAKVVFQYSSDEEDSGRTIDEESVTSRISEFLQDYASTIGQLKPDESILVIYGAGSSGSNKNIAVYLRGDSADEEPLPVISVSAQKNDLDAYRSGRLSANTFQNQLSVSKTEDKERLDLKVLGNIFGTALGEGDGNEFHLINNRSLSYMYLDNFGVLYSLNLHRGHGFGAITARLFEVNRDEDGREEIRAELEERDKELSETLQEEYDAVIARTKEIIIDYGRTLSSLNDDQHLLVSLNISESNDSVPERVDFQIQKSVFNQLDQGRISRDAALNTVTITEY